MRCVELAQQLSTLASLAGDLDLVPSTRQRLTTACNFSSRVDTLFCSLQALHACDKHTYTQQNTHTHKIK